jgi:parvulin-like peptidyl-prolyl isomerase
VSRLFYPTLLLVTATLAAMLWMRHGLPVDWLAAIDVRAAWGQVSDGRDPASSTPAASDRYRQQRYGTDRYGGDRYRPASSASSSAASLSVPRRRRRGYTSLHQPAAAPRTAALPETAHRTRPSHLSEALIEAPEALRSLGGGRGAVQGSMVLARIGSSDVILAADVLPEVEEKLKELPPAMPPEQIEMYRELLLQQHVMQLVKSKLVLRAAKSKLDTDKLPEMKKQLLKEYEKQAIPKIKKDFGVKTDEELNAVLKSKHTTREKIQDDFFNDWLIQRWLQEEVEFDETVKHEELLDYYHQHLDEYKFPAKAQFEELRVDFAKHRDKEEAWRLICELGNQVSRGADWAELAKARSEGLHADKGGRYDWISKGSLRSAPLDEAVFSLPIGQSSKVVEDDRGYSIVRVVDRNEAGVTSFEDAQVGIRDKIKAKRKADAQAVVLKKFFEGHRSVIWTAFDGTSLSGRPLEDAPQTASRPGSADQPRRR